MAANDLNVSISDVYKSIDDEISSLVTKSIVDLFIEHGLTYKIRMGYGNIYRIFCFIKKSKEALIINSIGKKFGPFEIQIRIKNKTSLDKLNSYSENIRDHILNGNDCRMPHCCNCGKEYVFRYFDKAYRKCNMLCDNFYFRNLKLEDIDSIMDIVKNEIDFDMPQKRCNVV